MRTIAIIGAGNIGSRHLQSFGKASTDLTIYVVDPSQASLDVSAQRWREVDETDGKVKTHYKNDLSALPTEIDFAVVATNSEHRLAALRSLLEHARCSNILLEKFLFSEVKEYEEAEKLLQKHKVQAWVNVVRRTFEAYRWLQSSIQVPTAIHISGSNWGMLSNSIHFIDLFSFLTRDEIKECGFESDVAVLESKRAGYIEFLGSFTARGKNGSSLRIDCTAGEYDKIEMSTKGDPRIHINEIGSKIIIEGASDTAMEFNYPYQSQLTLRYFDEILAGKPTLPSYQESARMHLRFLEAVRAALDHKKYSGKWKIT